MSEPLAPLSLDVLTHLTPDGACPIFFVNEDSEIGARMQPVTAVRLVTNTNGVTRMILAKQEDSFDFVDGGAGLR